MAHRLMHNTEYSVVSQLVNSVSLESFLLIIQNIQNSYPPLPIQSPLWGGFH